MTVGPQIRVAIIGAGISGLALANSLINDVQGRFDVQVFERDGDSFKEDRQGYLLTICDIGLDSLRYSTDSAGWQALNDAWGEAHEKSSALVDPKSVKLFCHLSDIRNYPAFRRISRQNLRGVLRRLPEEEGRLRYKCALDTIEMVPRSSSGQHEVKLLFQDPERNPPAFADIVIAADGSYSRTHEIMDLRNKFELSDWTLVQCRALIDDAKLETLPKQFRESGNSWLFIGGNKLGGFVNVFPAERALPGAEREGKASTTGSESELSAGQDGSKLYRLFCDFNIPRSVGERILSQAKGNAESIIEQLCSYVTDELQYDPNGIPPFLRAAPKHIRTGRLTSSREPADRDWRSKKSPAYGRIFFIGDAIHPMTPGRGMGANQALMDAHNLSVLLHGIADTSSLDLTDQEALTIAQTFDSEMYARAFDMVKQSEQSMQHDLTTTSGRVKLRAAMALFETAHSAATVLGKLRWRSGRAQNATETTMT